MTPIPHVSVHAVLRWVERIDRVDVEAVRKRLALRGDVHPTDAAVLAELELDGVISRAKTEADILTATARKGIELGAIAIRRAGLRLIIKGGCIVTVLGPDERRRSRICRGDL